MEQSLCHLHKASGTTGGGKERGKRDEGMDQITRGLCHKPDAHRTKAYDTDATLW